MRVFDSNKQAIADTQLEQCYGLTETMVIGSKTKELSCDHFFSCFAETQLREPVFGSGFWHLTQLEEQLYGEVRPLRVVEG
jgi:hypothetical protein